MKNVGMIRNAIPTITSPREVFNITNYKIATSKQTASNERENIGELAKRSITYSKMDQEILDYLEKSTKQNKIIEETDTNV